jgi:serine/threonine protein kinase
VQNGVLEPSAMAEDTRVGTELAGYQIEGVIGRGGMSVVYLAEHVRLGRKVALKVLSPELAGSERFQSVNLPALDQIALAPGSD